jgi:predicted nucleic acid-binding protein
MTWLFDTTLVSEVDKPRPDAGVMAWLASNVHPAFLSVITIGEMKSGIERMPQSPRRATLALRLNEILAEFEARILSVTTEVTLEWGRLAGAAAAVGRTLPILDSLIAATALVHNLTVVTRNVGDFEACGVPTVNPWSA